MSVGQNSAVNMRDGKTFDQARDGARLNAQHQRVWDVMKDGVWRPLAAIAAASGAPEASVSARLRDFRKERFGSHDVERRYVDAGLWEYRLLIRHVDLFTDPRPRAPLPRCEHFPHGAVDGLSDASATERRSAPT